MRGSGIECYKLTKVIRPGVIRPGVVMFSIKDLDSESVKWISKLWMPIYNLFFHVKRRKWVSLQKSVLEKQILSHLMPSSSSRPTTLISFTFLTSETQRTSFQQTSGKPEIPCSCWHAYIWLLTQCCRWLTCSNLITGCAALQCPSGGSQESQGIDQEHKALGFGLGGLLGRDRTDDFTHRDTGYFLPARGERRTWQMKWRRPGRSSARGGDRRELS